MADLDFGFTAVDQDELVTKTGEAAAIQEKIAEDLKKVAESSGSSASSAQLEELDGKMQLIGFSGAPFTLASYMIEGGGSRHYAQTKRLMYEEPAAWNQLLSKIVDVLEPRCVRLQVR